ncbi:hypothetical protein HUE87_09015 [Candidatus Sulfurimonas marisnigri]|uniref:Uncharacterized protein n=1 Tax=Candidatus Sulfurimonas marisnigri TaxID=2740405 RepID=A0A7S7RPV8_9BACT|nr:hypothetical protein [Candidatus Sulfurimonas marisnigri]QOY54026.1 hypothetical protein HUE87_09015 [Candidatus Sulfurimonas marisnigri]
MAKKHEEMKFYTISETMIKGLLNIRGNSKNKLFPFNNIDYRPQTGA